MKVSFSVVQGKHHFQLKGDEEMREYERRQERARKKALEQAPKDFPEVEVEVEVDPHDKVWEYDGSFKCLNCHEMWGALPGKPEKPKECKKDNEDQIRF